MAKQLNVNLAFTADTSKAKAQLQDLQHSLDSLIKSSASSTNLPLTKELIEAQNAAASLKVALDSAINTQTGKLDITKFSSSMKAANLDATTLRKHLENLGPSGNQAFLTLSKSVMSAEMPIRRTNALIAEMWTTLKNTARWQISSSILHGFMGTMQSAYGYAQDLDKSLNNIRIVTSQNADEMARFADRANKAAKALSATTTEYTNASLIYYQQGLSDNEVQKRTDITIKMAHAAGQSAEIVSDQLTAVWNNFYDGSESLEHYADVMTALGAATASSTDEIAGGLEKFASIADMIGLSYEYAASALATITAVTRQSEDVVGTALKTIFARIQGLNLGETLDDGTTLNKYSEALDKVGISIKDQNGELKAMDDILNEMGAKWDTLGKDQQIALAQTVAGVRQYNQLVSLMDNWDYFESNLNIAYESEGALEEQANIYAESWEAARDRVSAAAEDLYDSILDEDFFIGMLNGFEKVLTLVANLVDSLGGLPGVLAVVSTLVTKIFSKQLETSIDNMIYGINSLTGTNLKNSKATKEEYAKEAEKVSFDDASDEGTAIGMGMQQQTALQQELLANEAKLSETEKQRIQQLMDIHQLYVEQAAAAGKAADAARQMVQEQNKEARLKVKRSEKEGVSVDTKQFTKARAEMSAIIKTGRNAQKSIETLGKAFSKTKDPQAFAKQLDVVQNRLNQINKDSGSAKEFSNLVQQFKTGKITVEQFSQGLQKLAQSGEVVDDAVIAASDAVKNLGDGQVFTTQETDAMANAELRLQDNAAKANTALNAQAQQANNIKVAIAGAKGAMDTLATSIVGVMQGVSQIGMGISSFVSIINTLNNEDMSFGEKLLSITMSLSMALPALISGYKALTAVKWKDIAASTKELVINAGNLASMLLQKIGLGGLVGAKGADIAATNASSAANITWQATAWPILLITLLIVAAIGTLVAIAYVLVSAVTAISNAYNADAIAAENAATAAKNLGEAYNECKQEYQDMISAMENYQSARDALDDLTKGTEEYRQALKEANRQALELINQYKLIEGQDYEWEGDELVIKDSAMSRVRSEKEDEVDKAYAASQMANAEAKRTQAIADQTALRREMRDDVGLGDGDKVWGAIANGVIAGLGAVLAPVTGGLSLLATGAAFINQGLMEEKSQAYNAAIDKAIEESKTNANLFDTKKSMAEALELDDEDIIDALWANRESLEQLSADINAAAEAEKIAAQNAANEIMSESGYDRTEAGRMALEAGGEIYQQVYGEAYDKYLDEAKDRGLFNTGTKESKAAFEAYAKETGLDKLKNFEVTNYKGDGTVEYKYIDDDGEEQTKLATSEEIAATLAAAEAAKSLEGALSALREKISELNNSKNEADHALAEFISAGNLEGATKAEYDAIASEIGDTTNDADIEAYLDKKFDDDGDGQISDETAQKYGYENADAMVQAMKASLEIEWEIPEGIGNEIADQLTLGAAAKIQSAYEEMGEQGGKAFTDTISTIASGADWESLSLEDQTAMLDEIANIDWSSWDAGEQAIEIAQRYGIAIDDTTKAWQDNINAMRDATNALPDLEAMREEFEQIKEITKDIDLGSILSTEDYETLVKYNKELEKYFATLSDGSAQFIGDKLDFQQEIEAQHTQDLLEAMQVYKDRNNEILAQIEAGSKAVGGKEKLDDYRDSENYVKDDKNYYSGVNVNKQIDFLESQGYDAEQLNEWKLDLSNGDTTVGTLEEIAKAVDTTANSFNELGIEAEKNEAIIQGMMNEIALSAEDASERAELLESGLIDADTFGYAAMAAHNEEKWEDMDPEEVEDYADSLRNAAEASELLSDELKNNEEAAEDVALYTKKMNKGIEALAEGFEDWSDVLKKSDRASEEYSAAMNDMKSAMSDVLGVSEDFLSDDFILQNMEDIKLAAEGDAAAIDRLAIAAAQDILINVGFEDEGVKAEVMALHNELSAMIPDIQVGATLDDGDFLSKAAQVVETANMTVEEANAYFRALGFEPHFETKEVKTTVKKPRVRTHTDYAASVANVSIGGLSIPVPTFDAIQTSWNEGYTEVQESIEVPSLTTDGGKPNFTLTRTNSGSMNNYSGSNSGGSSPGGKSGGGGGGSTPSKPSKADKRDTTSKSGVVERYREIEDSLDNITDALTRAERATDRLWGKDKLKAMREENKILKQQYDLLQEKAEQAREYAEEDYAVLMKTASEVGINLSVDKETGDITNIEDAMETLYNRLSVAEEEYNKQVEAYNKRVDAVGSNPSQAEADMLESMKEALDVYEKDVIGKIEDDIAAVQEAEQTFQDSVETWEQAGLDMEEILDQIMQNNYEIIMQGLEIPLSLNEEDLRLVELKLSKLEDNVYQMAEALTLTMGKVDEYKDNLQLADEALSELNRAHEAGEITDAAYQEGLQEIKDTYYDNVEALMELDSLMKNYYGETLDAANEELSKYTEQMQHQTSVLEHYNNLINLMGKSNDYKMIGKVLEGQVETTKNAAEVSKNWYEARRADADTLAQQYQDALNSGASTEELEILKNNWQAAEQAANEAQEQMLSDAEAWAEALKAVLENKLSELGQALENALTGGWGSFDAMTTALERANSLQEEYLTTTNQVYETNKLMRTAQQAIDTTTNSVAKKKLAAYIEETKQLQDQSKLSSYELEIQQAKYDLLLAEIALEEAQDAKSTVRLQRDSEGNFGYVYTADSNKINEAQQQLEDAQNRLYNIGLEGANNYTEKYQQTMAEMYDTLNQIQQDYLEGSFESEEEYQAAMQSAKEYYYQKLQDYSSLYSVALTTDSRVVADAWSTDFSSMIYDTEIWMDAVNDYTSGAIGAFREWQNAVTGAGGVTEIIGSSLEEVAGNVNEVTNKSKDLADTTNDEVIPALNAEITSVENLTSAYAAMRDTIKETIEYYEKMISDINNAQNTEWNSGDSGEDDNETPENNGSGSESGTPNTGNPGETQDNETVPGTDTNPNITGEGEGTPTLPSYKKGTLSWTGNGSGRVWTDSAGKTYSASSSEGKAIQAAFNRAYSKNGGYKGDYFLGWNQLNADVLHKKYGLSTGGYTGDWSGSYGKLAFLHQKELVLNAQDTQNFLESMNVLDKIISAIDLYSMNSQLGGILSSPALGRVGSDLLEQQVHIEASFPGVQDRNEIEEAFNNLINQASQYANRK